MKNKVVLTEDNFDKLYKPMQNPIDKDASFGGTLFETFGDEIQFVLSFANKEFNKVWTVIESEGDMFCTAGYHLMNRIGYIITEIEWKTGQEEFKYEGTYDLITDSTTLNDFFETDGDDLSEDLKMEVLEIVYKNPIFEFKKSDDKMRFILNVWEHPIDYQNKELPTETFTFMLLDYTIEI